MTIPLCLTLAASLLAAESEFGAAHVFVADHEVDAVAEYTNDGEFVKWHGLDDPDFPGFADPYGMAFGPDGKLYVCCDTSGDLYALGPEGIEAHRANDGTLASPRDVTFGPRGRLFVSSHGNDRIVEFDLDLEVTGVHPCPAGFGQPTSSGFDPDGRLWVASEEGMSLYVLDLINDSKGPTIPLLGAPAGIGFEGSSGWLIVSTQPAAGFLWIDDAFEAVQLGPIQQNAPSPHDFAPVHDFDELTLFRGADAVVREGFGPFGSIDFGQQELEDPVGLAVAPWRFKVKIKGRGSSDAVEASHGPKGMKIVEKAVLSLYPGTLQAFLALDAEGELASSQWFGDTHLVLTGFRGPQNGRLAQRLGAPVAAPSADLVLSHELKPKSYESLVKSPSGRLRISLSTAQELRYFRGKIKNAKPLNKP